MTAPDTDHAERIKELVDALRRLYLIKQDERRLGEIRDHANALQAERDDARAELAAERARVERLRAELVREVNRTRQMHGYSLLDVSGVARHCGVKHLQPGDIRHVIDQAERALAGWRYRDLQTADRRMATARRRD